MFEAKVTQTISREIVLGILVTGIEQGISYWAKIEKYQYCSEYDVIAKDDEKWNYDHLTCSINGGGRLYLRVLDEDDKIVFIDREGVERGLQVMADKYPDHWADLISEKDDAITGDVFIQCVVFGEAIYG